MLRPEIAFDGTTALPRVTIFGSARPVTCAVMDYSRRLCAAINARRPGFIDMKMIEPDRPMSFVGEITASLRHGQVAHFQMPVEGWGNSIVPGSALFAARAMTRKGKIAMTLHEWTSLNQLRYLSMVPDILASDGFIFVSQSQRETFLRSPLVGKAKKAASPVIPIGPNIMPSAIDPDRVVLERGKVLGEGANRADLVIGHFGVLYASKRPDLLLRVIQVLLKRGIRARLLVCGDFLWDKPQDRAAFFALADELGVREWLDFRGRIEDEAELMATLAASDVFLLPYTDGISARRSSFQAISNLAIPLVSTTPERADEFDVSSLLKSKIANKATILRPADSSPEVFADASLAAYAMRDQAIKVDLAGIWDEAAIAHLAYYDRLMA